MTNPYMGQAVAQAGAGFSDQRARLKEARAMQSKAEMELQEFKTQAPNRQSKAELELAQTKEQLYQLQAGSLTDKTYTAFSRFDGDGDARHLNTFLQQAKSNPLGQNLYAEWSRWDTVTRTPANEQLLRAAGVKDVDGYFSQEDPTHNFVVGTKTDGSQQLLDLDKVYAMSGYTAVMQKSELQKLHMRQQRTQLLKAGITYDKMATTERLAHQIADQQGIPLSEAYQLVNKSGSAGSSMLERIARQVMQDNPGMPWDEALQQAVALTDRSKGSELEREVRRVMDEQGISYSEAQPIAKKNLEKATTAQKDLGESDNIRQQMHDIAGGDFFKADMSDRDVRRKIAPLVSKLEKLTGQSLDTEDKRLARQIRELTSLGKTTAEEIGPEETGLLDSMLNQVKKYVSDNVDSTKGTAAYETFRNVLRNALYGATLTAGEIKAFNTAVGNLGQQTGPVLQQFKTQLQQLRSRMQAIYDFNDEYVAQYYLGTGLEDVDRVIEALDNNLAVIAGTAPGNRRLDAKTIEANKQVTQSMDEIFGDTAL